MYTMCVDRARLRGNDDRRRQAKGAGYDAGADSQALRRRGHHAPRRRHRHGRGRHPNRLPGAGRCTGRGRDPQGAYHRGLWPRVVRQDDAVPAHHRRMSAPGRGCGLYRCRARIGFGICRALWREHRRVIPVPAGYGRAGTGNHRGAGAQRSGGLHCDRLCGCSRAAG